MRRIYVATNRFDAYLLRDRLAQVAIEANIFNEFAHGALGDIPLEAAYPQLWVEDIDLPKALAIVREFAARPSVSGSRICGYCKEENPESFELCWKCGAGL